MTFDLYKIVFDGELVPGMAADVVKDNLIRLFNSDTRKIERLFGHGPVNIKRDLSGPEADKYLQALHRAGAKARKEPEQVITLALLDNAPERSTDTQAAADQMSCPKCGHGQTVNNQCERCGIVIEKYLARQAQNTQAINERIHDVAAQPYAPPRAQVGEPTPEYGELKAFTIQGRIGRLRYLAWSMTLMAAALGLLIIASMGFAISPVLGSILAGLLGIGVLLVSVQISIQRLHDIGWTGWFMLLNLVPVVGTVFPLALLLVPGNKGVNRFGPPQPPNSRAVKILAALWLLMPVIGVLVAIAIPGYQQYVDRAAL
ncbi:DUF805 domain-containing protein [Stutzerimonas sp. VN223-3]|uniref:DUF805 domain-containing protein n=1 Tax=Stutzerimonas sp. VN223-3 TaxID=3384601 RepID=UPI0038B5D018